MVRWRIRLLVFALAGIGGAALAQAPDTIAIDEPFPALVLPSAEDGRALSIADFRGQRLVLHVFASW